MRIIICGAGLIGVTTAYALALRGHQVEVIERQPEVAAETSFANGGQLSYCHAEPWASPTVLKKLPKWLLHEDSPLIFRLRADIPMVLWGLKFLRNCTDAKTQQNCINLLRLGLYSRNKMAEIVREAPIEFDYLKKGILHIYSTEHDLELAVKQLKFQEAYGSQQRVLTKQEAIALEPELAFTERKIVGAIHSPQDESGDPKKFCEQLMRHLQEKFGVKFHFNTTIKGFKYNQQDVEVIHTDKGEFKADAYVVAMASYSPQFLNKLGVSVPVYPMKGYSITVPVTDHAPQISVTDGTHKIVYSRLGDRMRVAGTAEFAGYNTQILDSRINPIIRAAQILFPKIDWQGNVQPWACLRPSTPDGPPRIGRSHLKNLYVNTGHGTLGWTQAAGSAFIMADIIERKTPEIVMNGMTLGDSQ